MRVALLSPHAVEVGDSGDRRRTLDLADALAEEGIEPEIIFPTWRSSTSRHADSPREVELTLARSRPVYLPWRLGLAARRIGNPYALHRDHRLRAAIIGAIQEREYDVVDVQHSYMDCRWPIPTVLTVHNVLANPDFLAGTRYQRRTVKKLESTSLADCDRAIVFSESERRRVTAIYGATVGQKAAVVPIAHPLLAPEMVAAPQRVTRAMFLGSMDYAPNVEGARRLLDWWPQIISTTSLRELVIVGRKAAQVGWGALPYGVTIKSDVKEVESVYAEVDVSLMPLLRGGGIRMKALEAMAYGVPIVASRLAVEGLDLRHEETVLLAEDLAEMIAALQALTDPTVYVKLREQARRHWETGHSASAMTQSVLDVYRSAIDLRRRTD